MGSVEFKPLHELLSLSSRRALITGAASGIGRAISMRFAEAGAALYLADIDEGGLTALAKEIGEVYRVEVRAFHVDLSKKSEIDDLWASLRGEEPDVLVNNAGVYEFIDFPDVDEASLERALAVNLKAAFYMCQHMVRSRGKKGGVIINVGSIESILPFAKKLVHYDVSKMGVIALTRALAREYGSMGFRVNAIVPGGIRTPGVERVKRDALLRFDVDIISTGVNFMLRLPLKRFGDPDEVARVAVFLASEMASYVHGAIIPVDGGFLSA